jgi:predicted membrane-bound mannosyltransferase
MQGQQLFYFRSSSSSKALGVIQLAGARISAVAVASRSAAAQLDHHLIEIAPDPQLAAAAGSGVVEEQQHYRQYRLAAATLELQVGTHVTTNSINHKESTRIIAKGSNQEVLQQQMK